MLENTVRWLTLNKKGAGLLFYLELLVPGFTGQIHLTQKLPYWSDCPEIMAPLLGSFENTLNLFSRVALHSMLGSLHTHDLAGANAGCASIFST